MPTCLPHVHFIHSRHSQVELYTWLSMSSWVDCQGDPRLNLGPDFSAWRIRWCLRLNRPYRLTGSRISELHTNRVTWKTFSHVLSNHVFFNHVFCFLTWHKPSRAGPARIVGTVGPKWRRVDFWLWEGDRRRRPLAIRRTTKAEIWEGKWT